MIELKLTVDIPALDRLIPILEKYSAAPNAINAAFLCAMKPKGDDNND